MRGMNQQARPDHGACSNKALIGSHRGKATVTGYRDVWSAIPQSTCPWAPSGDGRERGQRGGNREMRRAGQRGWDVHDEGRLQREKREAGKISNLLPSRLDPSDHGSSGLTSSITHHRRDALERRVNADPHRG
jgi:hypothetical protein